MKPLQEVRRPLVGMALAVAAGLAAGRSAPVMPPVWFACSALIAALAGRLILRSMATPLLYLTCAVLAAAAGSLAQLPDAGRTVTAVAGTTGGVLEMRGVVSEDPALGGEGSLQSFVFRTEEICYAGRRVRCRLPVRIYPDSSAGLAAFGERWILRGRYVAYDPPRGSVEGFLRVAPGGARRLQPAGRSLLVACNRLRQRGAAVLAEGIRPFTIPVQVLQALMLGYRQSLASDLYRIFSRSGVFHIFAISGLHVGVMASILIAALKLSGIARPRWGWLLIPALFSYVVATGMKPSALRAFLMAAVYFAAPLAGRRPDGPSSVALAAILLLAWRPGYVNDPGFLLSFVVVGGLLMVQTRSEALFVRWTAARQDRVIPVAGGGWPGAWLRYPFMLLATSLAAWFFSVPVSVQFFNQLTLAALAGNPLVIPLAFMIMLTGSLALLAGALFLPAAALFNQANLVFVDLLLRLVAGLSGLPGGCLILRAPGVPVSGLWYAGLVLFLTGPARWRRGAALLFAGSLGLWLGMAPDRGGGLRICRAADDAVAVRLPGDRWALAFDGTRDGGADRLLRREGVGRIETLLAGEKAEAAAIGRLAAAYRPQEQGTLPTGKVVPLTAGPGILLRAAR